MWALRGDVVQPGTLAPLRMNPGMAWLLPAAQSRPPSYPSNAGELGSADCLVTAPATGHLLPTRCHVRKNGAATVTWLAIVGEAKEVAGQGGEGKRKSARSFWACGEHTIL